jgi:hypothetical protein
MEGGLTWDTSTEKLSEYLNETDVSKSAQSSSYTDRVYVEVLCSNLGWDTGYLDWGFLVVSASPFTKIPG